MGRAKVKMEFINNDKARHLTFNKRKESLIRKLYQLSTLCDVKACMIISGGGSNLNITPEVWPKNPEQVNEVINFFKSCKSKGTTLKDYGLHDFFRGREKKIMEDVAKLRQKNLEAKFPTRPDLLIKAATELKGFLAILSSKAQQVKSRIELLRRATTTAPSSSGFYSPLEVIENKPYFSIPSSGGSVMPHTGNNSVALNMSCGELMPPSVNHNSMPMMLLMNENRQVFLGAAMQPWYYPAPPHAQHYMLQPPPPPPQGQPQPYILVRHFSNPDQHEKRNG